MKNNKKNWPLYFVWFFSFVWLLLSYSINTAQYGDNFEQFDWAHGVEISYWKHPPITTWLLAALNNLIGVHPFNTYLLCFLCLSVTVYFYRRLAGLILSQKAADLSLLFLASSFMFTWRAQLYNHNLTLVMMTVVSSWYFFSLIQKENIQKRQWLFFGVLAALAILTKYQAVISLFGLLVAFFWVRKKPNRQEWLGFGLVLFAFFAVLAPHIYWFYKNYSLISQYTFHFFSLTRPWVERANSLTGFLLQQLRFFLVPLLIYLLILKLRPASSQKLKCLPLRKVFLFTQVLLPVICVAILNQIAGMGLANHWGFSIFVFLPIFLAGRLESRLDGLNISLLKIFIVVQCICIALFVGMKLHAKHSIMTHKYDEFYPGQMISDVVSNEWKRETNCPLRYIDGPPFEAGIVSVYSGSYPAVLEGGEPIKSPWIDLNDMKQQGYILMKRNVEELRKFGPVFTLPLNIKQQYQPLRDLYWVNVLPQKACEQ